MTEEIRRKSSAAFPSVIHAKEVTEVGWFSTMMVWGIFLLVISIAFYGGVQFVYLPSVEKEIQTLTQDLRNLSTQISKEQREQVLGAYSQVLNIKSLLKNHVYPSRLLTFLEKNTHQGIFIENINVSLEKGTVDLIGKGPSKEAIIEQVFAFESAAEVQSVKLTDAQFQNDPASFHILITLKPGLVLSSE